MRSGNSVRVFSGLAMFSIGAHLFKPDDFAFFALRMQGKSFFDLMVEAESVSVEAAVLNGKFYMSITMRENDEVSMEIGMLLNDIPMRNRHLRVLQRAVRRFHWVRKCARRLAAAMALHHRLGAACLLGGIGQDLLTTVLDII